ncbi:hypothetical protein DL96DRAFT_1101592 [Flagelloscypha sp. PMI_526]|nr:hypothetical protein DL96DRAFT_1101592 [Flagelloscypha sp. PMI_526]
MLSFLCTLLVFLLALPRTNASRVPHRRSGVGYYMSFSEGAGLWLPNMGAMNELMVGDKDGDGGRKPRRNCIFYVNQRPPMTERDPNWAKERAKQFAQLMNLAQAGSDHHTLYDVFDLEAAFNPATAGPMADALESGLKRPWFEATSAGYAHLCEGTVYLVCEEEEIWNQAIWMTHERDALWNSGRITRVVEIRPADIGRVYDGGGSSVSQIPHHPYRGGQPPGATPPRDIDSSEIPAGIKLILTKILTRRYWMPLEILM